MTKEQSKQLTIPVTPLEFADLQTKAESANRSLAIHCRELLGLESKPADSVTPVGPDILAGALVTALDDESVEQDAVVERLKQAPVTDGDELDKALEVVREAVSAQRAFARDARIAISAFEEGEDEDEDEDED